MEGVLQDDMECDGSLMVLLNSLHGEIVPTPTPTTNCSMIPACLLLKLLLQSQSDVWSLATKRFCSILPSEPDFQAILPTFAKVRTKMRERMLNPVFLRHPFR